VEAPEPKPKQAALDFACSEPVVTGKLEEVTS